MTRARRSFGRLRKCQPSGRWQASYVGPDDRLYKAKETFAAKVDAEGWLHERRREIDRELWSPPASGEQKRAKRAAEVKFGDYATRWVETRTVKGRPLRPRTREHYESLLEAHIYPTFRNKAVRDISMESVDRWYAKTATDAPTVRAHAYSLLRTILETARKRERLIDVNPCEIVGASTTERKTKTKLATIEQLATIITEMPERFQPMILLATWCALRFGELVELRRKDVDIVEGVVSVRRGAVRVSGGWVVGPPKSEAGNRDVNIPPHILPVLKDHLASKHVAAGPEALLFPPTTGERLQPSTFYRHYYRARAKAKRDDLRFHDLRQLARRWRHRLVRRWRNSWRASGTRRRGRMRYQHAAQGRDKLIAAELSKLGGTVGNFRR